MSVQAFGIEHALDSERSKERKLQIIFGPWWRHYAVPYEFRTTLYVEHERCPYCDGPLGPLAVQSDDWAGVLSAHIDHMDPLSRGGEDSVRNALYVCGPCNLSKGRMLFGDWLTRIPLSKAGRVRSLYEEKHGHAPEVFVAGRRSARLSLPRLELNLDENVLRRLFPRPIVSGPPRCSAKPI